MTQMSWQNPDQIKFLCMTAFNQCLYYDVHQIGAILDWFDRKMSCSWMWWLWYMVVSIGCSQRLLWQWFWFVLVSGVVDGFWFEFDFSLCPDDTMRSCNSYWFLVHLMPWVLIDASPWNTLDMNTLQVHIYSDCILPLIDTCEFSQGPTVF